MTVAHGYDYDYTMFNDSLLCSMLYELSAY